MTKRSRFVGIFTFVDLACSPADANVGGCTSPEEGMLPGETQQTSKTPIFNDRTAAEAAADSS